MQRYEVGEPNASGRREFRYRVRARDAAGRWHSRTFRRRADADAYLRQVESEVVAGVAPDLRARRELLGDYFARWIDERDLAPRTVELYRSLWRRWIGPTFAVMPIERVTAQSVRSWHAKVLQESSPTTAAKAYRLLAVVLRTLERDGVIAKSPCQVEGAATEKATERPLLDPSQVVALAVAIEPRYRLMVEFAGWCGLRLGELLGLERRHVDLLHRSLRVDQQAQEVVGRGRMLAGPKTDAGVRLVPIPSPLVPDVERHLQHFTAADPESPVFTGPYGGPLRRASFYHAWNRARTAAGVPDARFHDLRHAAATLAAQHGATEREVMAQLGHASPDAARRYQHAAEERRRLLADRVADVIAMARATPGTAPSARHPGPKNDETPGAPGVSHLP